LSSDKAVLARDPFPINANRNACDWAATIIALIGFDALRPRVADATDYGLVADVPRSRAG
jgi:hypothetical protein